MNVYQPLNAKQNPDSEKSYQQTCPTITPEEDVIIIFVILVRNQICPTPQRETLFVPSKNACYINNLGKIVTNKS